MPVAAQVPAPQTAPEPKAAEGHLHGRVAIVSGVARAPGIGRATALRLAAAGAHVVCADLVRTASPVQTASHVQTAEPGPPADTAAATPRLFDEIVAEVRAAGPGEVLAARQSAADAAAWETLARTAIEHFGRLDICCALNGVTGPGAGDGPLLSLDPRAWHRCLDLNLTATWLLAKAAAEAMIGCGRPGAIVALSSHAAQAPAPGTGALGAARAGVQHLIAVLAQELAPHAIRCNAVSPLAVSPTERFPNPGLVALAERAAGSLGEWLARTVPLGRAQQPEETAAVIEFLCSDQASYLTGVTVPVNGGAR